MKTTITVALLLAMSGTAAWAHESTSPVLATSHTVCKGKTASTQDVTIHQNGTVDGKADGKDGASTLNVKLDGDIVTMVQTLPYGTITRRFDMAAYQQYMKMHPSAAASDEKAYQSLVAMIKANCASQTHFQHDVARTAGH